MAKTAILTDVHGNLIALQAVLAELDTLDIGDVVFGGDIVGYGARPAECVALVRERGGRCVLGNHDHYLNMLARQGTGILPATWRENPVWAGVVHALEQLDEEARAWLGSRPMLLQIEGGIVCHASLHDPFEWRYLMDDSSALATIELLRDKGPGMGFFGHTHQLAVFADPKGTEQIADPPGDRFTVPEGLACALTCGSVGQPRQAEDRRATWVLWDPAERQVEFRRTEYAATETAREILAAGLPAMSAVRLLSSSEITELLGSDHGG